VLCPTAVEFVEVERGPIPWHFRPAGALRRPIASAHGRAHQSFPSAYTQDARTSDLNGSRLAQASVQER
jgi:hypothetical protein